MRKPLAGAAFIAIAAAAACSLYKSADDDPARADAGDDAVADGITPPPPGSDGAIEDTGSDGGPSNLVKNGDMEFGCASFEGRNATLTESVIGHGGARSCRVCVMSPPGFGVGQDITTSWPAGASYLAEAWVRTDDDGGPPNYFGFGLTATLADGGTQKIEQSPPTLDATWRRVTAAITPSGPGTKMVVEVSAATGGGPGCFLMDDVTLQRQP